MTEPQKYKEDTIKISPLNRLTRSFDIEMGMDRVGLFGVETYGKYLDMQVKSEEKLMKSLRSLCYADAALFLLLSGQQFVIPMLGIEISNIPAILEITLFFSAITMIFMCTSFVDNQTYVGIVEQFGIRVARTDHVDPEFFTASRKLHIFFIKIFRSKLNIFEDDFFRPARGFQIFSKVVSSVVALATFSLLALHLAISIGAASNVLDSADWAVGLWLLIGVVAMFNFAGVAMVVGMSFDFSFHEIQSVDPQSSESPTAAANETKLRD